MKIEQGDMLHLPTITIVTISERNLDRLHRNWHDKTSAKDSIRKLTSSDHLLIVAIESDDKHYGDTP